jgi:hypothetical protein
MSRLGFILWNRESETREICIENLQVVFLLYPRKLSLCVNEEVRWLSCCPRYTFPFNMTQCILRQEFEDTKWIIRNRISKKNFQEKAQKDKQRSTKNTHETKDRVTRIPLQIECELKWFGRVSSSCSTSETRRVNIVINSVINHEW